MEEARLAAAYPFWGRLSGGETFTYLKYDPTKDMQFIEYSTGGGTKRGYVRTSDGTPQSNTILAKSIRRSGFRLCA